MALQVLDEQDTRVVRDSELGLDDGGDPETTYTIRVITPAVQRRLQKAAVGKKPMGGRVMSDEVDPSKFTHLLLDYLIVSWSGIVNSKTGEAIDPDQMVQTQDGPMKAKFVVIDQARMGALSRIATTNEVVSLDASFRRPSTVL